MPAHPAASPGLSPCTVPAHWAYLLVQVRKAKRPDYYGLLNVPSIASGVEIKAAYKQQALVWHPDKHANSEEARKVCARAWSAHARARPHALAHIRAMRGSEALTRSSCCPSALTWQHHSPLIRR